MAELTAKHFAKVFSRAASLMELAGENQFGVRAMQSAARYFQRLSMPLDEALKEISSGKAAGFGKRLREHVEEISSSGTLSIIAELEAVLPDELPELLRLPGLGGKKVRALWQSLGITSLHDLEEACKSGQLAAARGFGAKSAENILAAIQQVKSYRSMLRLDAALELNEQLAAALSDKPDIKRVEIAGELRRRLEVISESVLLIECDGPQQVLPALKELPGISGARSSGAKISAAYGEHPLVIAAADGARFGRELLNATGSTAHLEQLQQRADELAVDLTHNWKSEDELYAALSLAPVPPELREGLDELETAAQLFKAGGSWELLEETDIKGVVHAHSHYSDGANTLEEMARGAHALGYEYLAISDHSRAAAYAGGLSIEQVERQQEEIDRLNEELAPFRIFKGIESDILEDGTLDYPEEILRTFDFVIASIHSRFQMKRSEMTKRICAAVENPYTTILGHATGRLLLQREPYDVDVEQILEACAASGAAVEINAQPKRLDLDWRRLRQARKLHIPIAICPDAHSISEIKMIRYGVMAARKAGVERNDVLNARSCAEFAKYLEQAKP